MARAGRKPKPGKREPNGRLDRKWAADIEERETMSVGLNARIRHYGLSLECARDAMAGSVIGRMALHGEISTAQHEAAIKYMEVCDAHSRALEAKSLYGKNPPKGWWESNCGTHEDFCAASIARFDAMMDALRELMMEQKSPAPLAALNVIIGRDQYVGEMAGDLRLALNLLHRHFFQGRRRARAKQKTSLADH